MLLYKRHYSRVESKEVTCQMQDCSAKFTLLEYHTMAKNPDRRPVDLCPKCETSQAKRAGLSVEQLNKLLNLNTALLQEANTAQRVLELDLHRNIVKNELIAALLVRAA